MGNCQAVKKDNNIKSKVEKYEPVFHNTEEKNNQNQNFNTPDLQINSPNKNKPTRKTSMKSLPSFVKLVFTYFESVIIHTEDKVEVNKTLLQFVKTALIKINDVVKLDYLPKLTENELDYFDIFVHSPISNSWNDISIKVKSSISNFTWETLKQDEAQELKIKLEYKGLMVLNNLNSNYYLTNLLSKPIEDLSPLELLVFNKKTNSLSLHVFNEDLVPNELKVISYYNAYCNAIDKLFISGNVLTEGKQNSQQFFFKIDLNNFLIYKLSENLEPRYWHSMIFIPGNYIFFVGGVNTKNSVEYYNIETKEVVCHSILNQVRCDPSLICVNSTYLYAFCGYNPANHSYLSSIERVNLRKKKPLWEIVSCKNLGDCSSRAFGVINVSTDKILIIGGIDINKTDHDPGKDLSDEVYSFDTKTDTFEKINVNFNVEAYFSEKFFMPIEENVFGLIPLSTEHKILVYSNQNLKKILYDENENANQTNDLFPEKMKSEVSFKTAVFYTPETVKKSNI